MAQFPEQHVVCRSGLVYPGRGPVIPSFKCIDGESREAFSFFVQAAGGRQEQWLCQPGTTLQNRREVGQ